MKMACELVVFEILPTVRGELSKILVKDYGYTQAKVAQIFNVTSAAISQYIKGLRGGNKYIDSSIYHNALYDEIALSAKKIHEGTSNIAEELCCLCNFVKRIGMLDEIYMMQDPDLNLAKCAECPRFS